MSKLLKKILFFLMITTSSFSLYEHEINSLFSDEEIEHNEVLVIEQELKVETVDPLLLRDTYSRRAMNYLYAQLFRANSKGEVTLYLLAEYKRNDEMEMYCKLRDDIYFSNEMQ